MAEKDEPKIIVDSDWKAEARKEKEKLDEQTRERARPEELPGPSILEIVQMLVMQATIGLGGLQDPQTGQRIPPNLALARHYIDLLALLQEKTAGKLDAQEKQIIDATLNELRLAFVQMAGAGAGPEPPETTGGAGAAPAPGGHA